MRISIRLSSNSLLCSLQQTLQKGFLQLGFQPLFLSLPQAVFCFICIIVEPQPFPGAFALAMPCKMGAVYLAACASKRDRRDVSTGAKSSVEINAPSVCSCDMQDVSIIFSTCMLDLSPRHATLIFKLKRRLC